MTGQKIFLQIVIVAIAVLPATIGRAGVDDTKALVIEKVLDEPASINFRNLNLEDAFDRLSKDTGITFDISQAQSAIAQLPYGRLTPLDAQISGLTWREAIGELLKPLALRFQPGSDRVYIIGTDELIRQPRRLNRVELNAIVQLQNTNLNDSESKLLKQIRQATRLNFGLMVNSERKEKADKDHSKKILSSFPQSANKVLDAYSKRLIRRGPGTWYIRAELENGRADIIDIVIVPAKKLIEMKLDRRINIDYRNIAAQTILGDLADQAGLTISFEPGCIGLLDENIRQDCSLVMRGGTIKSALEALAGLTGLAYDYDQGGIHISSSDTLRQSALAQPRRTSRTNPLICIITSKVAGTDFETMILIRQKDLEAGGLLEKYQQLRQDELAQFIRYLQDYPNSAGEKR